MTSWRSRLDYAWRIVATGLCFGSFGLSCIVANALVFPLIRLTSSGAATRRRVRRGIHYGYRFSIGMARALGVISYEVHGVERLAAPGQLVVANHPSLIDVLFIGSRMPEVDCIVKDALLRSLLLRAPVRWADYITNKTPTRLIQDCVATLRAGNSLLVFAEGTRSVPGQPLILKRGAAHIAIASGCNLLPVTIHCQPSTLTKTDVWYRVPKTRPHWCIRVGEPVELAKLIIAGESESRAARRITDHLRLYFAARIALPAPTVAPNGTACLPVRASANSSASS